MWISFKVIPVQCKKLDQGFLLLKIKKLLVYFLLLQALLFGCSHDEKTVESGYDDGFAEGYNTQCGIKGAIIHGHWDSAEYSKGYNMGSSDGIQACLNDKNNNIN